MKIKLSNKILLGGFLLPIVLFLGAVIYFSANSTDDPEHMLGNHWIVEQNTTNWNIN